MAKLKLTGLEREPLTYDYEGIIQWLVDSKWVENYVKKVKGPHYKYIDDTIQEVWLQLLLAPRDRVVSAFNLGKPRLIAYFKAIINNNIISTNSRVYSATAAWDTKYISLSDVQWDMIDINTEDIDYRYPIEKNTVQVENPFDELYNDYPTRTN